MQELLDIGFAHDRTTGKEDWLTPPEIIRALGTFDLDPCSPMPRPWDTAAKHYTLADNGLLKPWTGRVWLNPPYGNETPKWLERLAKHGGWGYRTYLCANRNCHLLPLGLGARRCDILYEGQN